MRTRSQHKMLAAGVHGMLIPVAIITLIPFVWLVLASVKTAEDFAGSMFLPRQPAVYASADGEVEAIARVHELHPELVEAAEAMRAKAEQTRNLLDRQDADRLEGELAQHAVVVRGDDGSVREYRVRSDAGLRVGVGEAVEADEAISREFTDLSRFTFENYVRVFTEAGIGRALVNSLFLSSVAAVLATFFCAAGGYALARHRFVGRGVVTLLVLGSIVVPPALLLAPTYELLFHLDLLDTFTGIILPAAAPAFGVFLFRQATIQAVPPALVEAARIDGASEVSIFWQMALPLVRPMVGAFMLITFLATWNNFIGPQVVLQTAEKYPLSVAVAQLRGLYQQEYGMLMAGTVVSVVPVAALFLVLQRDFIAGLTSGAVKG